MGDPRQQLLAALLIPAGALHGRLQPLSHLIKGGADGGKFVRLPIGDAVVQVSLSDPADPRRQKRKGRLDPAEHEPGQEAVRQQDGANDGGQYQQGRQRHRQPKATAEALSRRSQEADQNLLSVDAQALQINAPPLHGHLDRGHIHLFRGPHEPFVQPLAFPIGINNASVFHHYQTHGAGVQQRRQPVKLPPALFLLRIQPSGHRLSRRPSCPVKIPAVLESKSGAPPYDQPDHADAEHAHNGSHDDRDNDHEDIGPEQTLPDRHTCSSLWRTISYIITRASAEILNCN